MMHTGAAEDNESNNGCQSVPVDSFDEENQVHLRLFMSYYEKKGLDTLQILIYLFELMSKKNLEKVKDVEYSKKFFTKYYLIDAETFNKWMEHFCPELYTTDFKKKRKFNNEETNLIFEKLGTIPNGEILPSTRKELIDRLPNKNEWKKSKNYESIQVMIDENYSQYNQLNKLPPILVKKLLFEETLDQKHKDNNRDLKLEKEILMVIKFFEYYFPKYTDWEWEIRKRWVRRFFNKSEDE